MDHLDQLEARSIHIIREAYSQFKSLCMLWSIGKDSTDIADSYYDAADQIYNNMEYPDEESANYASAVNSYLNSQLSYERLMEQGDNNTNDAETIKLGYDRTEANLAKQAQDQMISYWSSVTQLESQRAQVAQAESELQRLTLADCMQSMRAAMEGTK